jgi:hypothetical protein
MRTWRVWAVVIMAVIWMSCGGDNSSPSAPTGNSNGSNEPNNGNVNAVIDGVAWNGFASIITRSDVVVSISAYLPPLAGSPSGLVITFPPSTGTHTIGGANVTGVQYNLNVVPSPLWQARTNFGSGSIAVTALSSTATAGTFSVSVAPISSAASGMKTITGSFNVRF